MLSPAVLLTAVLMADAGAPSVAVSAVDFDTQIVPVLTKAGCNTGACHGAAIGRGGFKLSLYGSDSQADYQAIVHELEGRRVNLSKPEESLVFLKSTQSLTHGGGTRFDLESPAAQRVLQWLSSGAPRLQRRRLVRLKIAPETRVVEKAGTHVQLKSVAHFDDGQSQDVTAWTVFKANDAAAVEIDPQTAIATVLQRGENIIIARFLDQVVSLTLIVPLRDEPVDLSSQLRQNFIDELVLNRLGVLRVPVSPRADDTTLIRRFATSRRHDFDPSRVPRSDGHAAVAGSR